MSERITSITDLSAFVRPPGHSLMGAFKGYFDESGKEDDPRFANSAISVAGYVTSVDAWYGSRKRGKPYWRARNLASLISIQKSSPIVSRRVHSLIGKTRTSGQLSALHSLRSFANPISLGQRLLSACRISGSLIAISIATLKPIRSEFMPASLLCRKSIRATT